MIQGKSQYSPWNNSRRPRREGDGDRGGQRHTPADSHQWKKSRHRWYRRLGRTQERTGRVFKISHKPEVDLQTFQPVQSRYIDYVSSQINTNKYICIYIYGGGKVHKILLLEYLVLNYHVTLIPISLPVTGYYRRIFSYLKQTPYPEVE